MTTTEETRLQLEAIQTRRRTVVDAALDATDDLGPYESGHYQRMTKALHAAFLTVAAGWRMEADDVDKAMKRGWKSRGERLRASAEDLIGFAGGFLSPEFVASLSKIDDTPVTTEYVFPVATPPDGLQVSEDGPISMLIPAGGIIASRIGPDDEQHESEWYGTIRECRIGGHACIYRPVFEQWHPLDPQTGGPCSTAGCQPGEPWESSTVAYLKGDTDVIPIPHPALIGPVIEGSFGPTPPSSTTIAFVDPAPIAPERLSWAKFSELVAGLPERDHGSFSMITDMADCGMAWALSRLSRRDLVPAAMPAWYLVGGTAFHAATEQIERSVMLASEAAGTFNVDDRLIQMLWTEAFDKAIDDAKAESGVVDTNLWRVSSKGLENESWWSVQGFEMLKRYVAYHNPTWRETHKILVLPDGRPALELEITLDLDGWPFQCIIDQVWETPNGLFIDDLKSGKTKQPSTFQLGGYAHALAYELAGGDDYLAASPLDPHRFTISGAFYDARAGSHDMEVDNLLKRHPKAELLYRASAARVQAQQRAFLPRVSNFGGGCTSCAHRAICPAQS